MIKVVLKVLMLVFILRLGYKHRYRMMNMMLGNPYIRDFVVNKTRNLSSVPIGLITRVYL